MKKFLLSAFTVAATLSASADYADFTKVLYLPMDEVGETLVNKAGEAAELVEGNGATAVEGMVNGGIQFDGKTYYAVPHSEALTLGEKDWTIELIFKSVEGNLAGYAILFGCNSDEGDGIRNGDWVGIEFKNPNILFGTKGNGSKKEAGSPNLEEYLDNEWHHLVAVRDFTNTTIELYVDGVQLASRGQTANLNTLTPCYVAANPSPTVITSTDPLTGCLDEVALFDGAMSMFDIEERYEDLTTTGGINAAIASMENATVTVYNLNGVEVASGKGNVDSLVNGLDKDLYVVVVSNGTAREVKKFIKK